MSAALSGRAINCTSTETNAVAPKRGVNRKMHAYVEVAVTPFQENCGYGYKHCALETFRKQLAYNGKSPGG